MSVLKGEIMFMVTVFILGFCSGIVGEQIRCNRDEGSREELINARRTTAAALDVAHITKAEPENIVWKRDRLVKADGELFGEILMWFYVDETLTQEEEVINGD